MILASTYKLKLLCKEKEIIEKGNLKKEQARYFGKPMAENQEERENLESYIPNAEDRKLLFSK